MVDRSSKMTRCIVGKKECMKYHKYRYLCQVSNLWHISCMIGNIDYLSRRSIKGNLKSKEYKSLNKASFDLGILYYHLNYLFGSYGFIYWKRSYWCSSIQINKSCFHLCILMQEDGISFYLGRRKISLLYLQQIRNSKHTYLTHLI